MSRFCLLILVAVCLATPASAKAQRSFRHDTENFVVIAPDPVFARKIANRAEHFRTELAIQWLGHELPRWSEKCPVRVTLAPHSGGETSFAFMFNGHQRAEPTGWDMKIYGTPDRILDSVLPHEVTHTIFATHFRRPLPRWADEGACTTVEDVAEKDKNHGMLIHFLTSKPSRGIPFNRMFTMKDYPRDILPLYAQGYSVAKYLIMEKGRRHFLDYVDAGLNLERPGQELRAWNVATQRYYGYQSLSELQVRWERWVAEGSVEKTIPDNESNSSIAEAKPVSNEAPVSKLAASNSIDRANESEKQSPSEPGKLGSLNEGWYSKQMKVGRSHLPRGAQNGELDKAATSQTILR